MSQIKIVKGNDAPIQWRVSYQGQPLDLTGKAVTLYVINSRGPFQLKGFEVEGHVVTATYYGADQTRFGEHSLVLRLNEGRPEMSTVAVKEAFELVEWSKDQGGESGEPIKVTPIILEADVAVAQGGSSYDDTELREAIEDLDYRVATHSEEIANLQENKADKSELTELSAEVSGLSERIDNLPSGESSVFEAKYGETTYAEIVAAYNEGKIVRCNYDNRTHYLNAILTSGTYFVANYSAYSYQLICQSSDTWYNQRVDNSHELTTLDNGNAQITIAGKTAEVATLQYVEEAIQQSGGGGGMTTPSGDPMHYMFEAVGAEWNGTGADIEKQGVYGDTITHKAGYWYLNELGDITTEEMRAIYVESNPMVRRTNLENAFAGGSIRTNIAIWDANRDTVHGSIPLTSSELRGVCEGAQIEIFAFIKGPINKNIQKHMVFSASSLSMAFEHASKLSKIIGCFNCQSPTDYRTFLNAKMLKEVRLIRLKNSFSFAYSPLLSKNSVLFAIQNAEATSAITITLHADAYARLAEDADIVAALAEKTNVSLASA